MSEPSTAGPQGPAAPSPRIAEVAAEPAEEAVADERGAVGDQPDVGGLVPPDQSQ